MVLSWKQFGRPHPLDLALYPDIFCCHPWGEGGMLPLASERVGTRVAVNILSALDSPPSPTQKEFFGQKDQGQTVEKKKILKADRWKKGT